MPGYQRELTYRHDDGSYSAFGNRDDSGSTWLTAFVVRSFAQAQEYIYIDRADLDKSVNWFKSIQKENGCFAKVSTVSKYLMSMIKSIFVSLLMALFSQSITYAQQESPGSAKSMEAEGNMIRIASCQFPI